MNLRNLNIDSCLDPAQVRGEGQGDDKGRKARAVGASDDLRRSLSSHPQKPILLRTVRVGLILYGLPTHALKELSKPSLGVRCPHVIPLPKGLEDLPRCPGQTLLVQSLQGCVEGRVMAAEPVIVGGDLLKPLLGHGGCHTSVHIHHITLTLEGEGLSQKLRGNLTMLVGRRGTLPFDSLEIRMRLFESGASPPRPTMMSVTRFRRTEGLRS